MFVSNFIKHWPHSTFNFHELEFCLKTFWRQSCCEKGHCVVAPNKSQQLEVSCDSGGQRRWGTAHVNIAWRSKVHGAQTDSDRRTPPSPFPRLRPPSTPPSISPSQGSVSDSLWQWTNLWRSLLILWWLFTLELTLQHLPSVMWIDLFSYCSRSKPSVFNRLC